MGGGGFGEVWLCRSDAVGDFRALKFIAAEAPELLDKEFGALTRYRKAASRLRSPHLMPIEHVGRNAEGLYYVMPLADGSGDDPANPAWQPLTLSRLIQERASADTWFTCEEIANWTCPVLEALQTLVEAGFVHRDVKPDNIVIFGGQPVLTDIGLLHEDNATLTRRGTPGYLTPSWYQGGHPDMYGAAATLYTLLTGNLPDRMGRSAFNAPPQGDASLSAEERARRKQFHAVIRRATDERVAERYRDFRAMAGALSSEPRKRSDRKYFGMLLAWGLVLAVATVVAFSKSQGRSLAADKLSRGVVGVERAEKVVLSGSVSGPELATKGKSFVNSLGMKFVPVPGTDVLFCIHETRWKDYAEYARENPGVDPKWMNQIICGFPLAERAEDHPVVNASWEDAKAFCLWLSEKEKKTYRLPTDREWSIAVGLERKEGWRKGDTPESMFMENDRKDFPWGTVWPPPKGSGNYSDQSRKAKAPFPAQTYIEDLDDGFPTTAPVMSFKANDFGLYDMSGNVWEWVEDWWNADKEARVLRGGSWAIGMRGDLLSSHRYHFVPDSRIATQGFRVVLGAPSVSNLLPGSHAPASVQIPQPSAAVASTIPTATKDKPFENTLGMKFVPVPKTKVLLSVFETRVCDWAAFLKDSGYAWNGKSVFEQTPNNKGCIAAQPANTPMVEQARIEAVR